MTPQKRPFFLKEDFFDSLVMCEEIKREEEL
jgi:hypothetical protein